MEREAKERRKRSVSRVYQAEIRKSIIKHDEATAYPLGMELKMKHAVDHRSSAVLREKHAQNTDEQPISLSLRRVPPHRNNP